MLFALSLFLREWMLVWLHCVGKRITFYRFRKPFCEKPNGVFAQRGFEDSVLKESLVLCRVLEDRLQQFQVSFKCLFFVSRALSLSLSLSLFSLWEIQRESGWLVGFFFFCFRLDVILMLVLSKRGSQVLRFYFRGCFVFEIKSTC